MTQIESYKLTAAKGKIYTDGKIYGKVIYLGAGRKIDEFYEISEEEYNSILAKQIIDDEII